MKDKKLQVFVSSTYTDLKEERQAAVEAILSAGHIPAGMELFNAGDESQMTVIKRWIDQSDIYLLILGGRYGSIDPKTGKSYTHLEYEYAVEQNKPLFAVVINDDVLDAKVKKFGLSVIEQEYPKQLQEFKTLVKSKLVKFWNEAKDIQLAVLQTLNEFSYTKKELAGWVRGDNTVNTGLLAEEIARLTKENSELRSQLIKSTPSEVLYSGLTYEKLASLLKKVTFNIGSDQHNLISFMDLYRQFLSFGYRPDPANIEILDRLTLYKLVTRTKLPMGQGLEYKFTEDGHNFYLRTLSMLSEALEPVEN